MNMSAASLANLAKGRPTGLLTPRRRALVRFISEYVREHGRGPNIEQMCAAVGIARQSVYQHLDVLRRAGVISRDRDVGSVRVLINEVPDEVVALLAVIDRVHAEAYPDAWFKGNVSIGGNLFNRLGKAATAARAALERLA